MDDKELFARYRETRDIALRNEIVERHLYIASVLAKKFVGRGVDYDDLYQVAALALVKCVERFDETMGLQFATFATPTVTGEIKNYFRDRSRLVHLPRRVSELRLSVKRTADEIFSQTGMKPTAKEIATRLNVTEEEVLNATEAGAVVSLDAPCDDDAKGMSFHEVLPATERELDRIEERDVVESAMKGLTDEERALVKYRFTQELSQTETAKRMNVSQMCVSRMERKVLQKLKEKLKAGMAES